MSWYNKTPDETTYSAALYVPDLAPNDIMWMDGRVPTRGRGRSGDTCRVEGIEHEKWLKHRVEGIEAKENEDQVVRFQWHVSVLWCLESSKRTNSRVQSHVDNSSNTLNPLSTINAARLLASSSSSNLSRTSAPFKYHHLTQGKNLRPR